MNRIKNRAPMIVTTRIANEDPSELSLCIEEASGSGKALCFCPITGDKEQDAKSVSEIDTLCALWNKGGFNFNEVSLANEVVQGALGKRIGDIESINQAIDECLDANLVIISDFDKKAIQNSLASIVLLAMSVARRHDIDLEAAILDKVEQDRKTAVLFELMQDICQAV